MTLELQDYLVGCVVRIETSVGGGTGFFIGPGLVATCAHLVEDQANGDYPLSTVDIVRGRERYTAKVIRYAASPNPDLAVLEVDITDHPCAYLFEPVRADDALYVCGFPADGDDRATRLVLDGADPAGDMLKLKSGPEDPGLSGAPLLNLRTGGVCAILNTVPDVSLDPSSRAIPISILRDLFPGIQEIHERYHEEDPKWFDSSGIVGTVFAARTHLIAMKAAGEEPIQPILAPKTGMNAIDLLAPTTFKALATDEPDRGPLDIQQLLDRTRRSQRSLMIVGPAGSGRSSLLRFFGYKASLSCKNLGARGEDRLFPILLRANQLTGQESSLQEQILDAIRNSNSLVSGTSLPSTFLTDLAELPGLRLLIMLDGVDEIQNSRDLADLVDLIGAIQQDPGFGAKTQLLLTSRRSLAEHFRFSEVDVYEIQPLGIDSIEMTARQWLGTTAGSFLEQNGHLLESGLLSSPLALSVALTLFERHRSRLPDQLVELYRDLVSVCLESWQNQGLRKVYGAEILDNAPDIMGFVALELIRSATLLCRDWLMKNVARYFVEKHAFTEDKAEEAAGRFDAFASTNSLFLRGARERFYWSHRSFRDYFAASYLVKSLSEDGKVVKEIKGRWFDANWGEIPSLTIQLLGSEDRVGIVHEILSSGRDARLEFVTGLVRDGSLLPDPLVEKLVDELLLQSTEEQDRYGVNQSSFNGGAFSFDLLLSIGHLDPAHRALEGVASEPGWTEEMQKKAKVRLAIREVG